MPKRDQPIYARPVFHEDPRLHPPGTLHRPPRVPELGLTLYFDRETNRLSIARATDNGAIDFQLDVICDPMKIDLVATLLIDGIAVNSPPEHIALPKVKRPDGAEVSLEDLDPSDPNHAARYVRSRYNVHPDDYDIDDHDDTTLSGHVIGSSANKLDKTDPE